MALVMVLLVLLLTLAFFYLRCTMMQSMMMLWASVVSTLLTFSFYESVAGLFISRGYGLQWAHVGSYVLIFIVAFVVLRTVSELLIGINIDLGNAAKASAAVICGLLTGIIFSGNLLVAMGLLPLQGKVFYTRFDPSGPVVLSSPKAPVLSTDGFVSGLYGLISSGSMKSDKSFKVLHADYLTQIHLNKLKVQDKVLPVCSPEAIEIPSKKGQQPVRLWTSPDNNEFVVVRMGIHAKKVSEGGAGNAEGKLMFFPAQIRLIAKDKAADSTAGPLAGSAKAFYPVGFVENGSLMKADLSVTIAPDPKELTNKIFWRDVAFDMPQGYNPVLLQFKLNAVADLASFNVVKSTPEIEDALSGSSDEPMGSSNDPNGVFTGSTTPLPMEEGGVMDGNLILSDRTYYFANTPTGTLGSSGVPLIGSEYVRTFNNDADPGAENVTYTVTTSVRAIVWITMDDRWDATERQTRVDSVTSSIATAGTFQDTDLNIYVGGDSDRPMSVYAAELEAGTYVFGANQTDYNFYLIGAVSTTEAQIITSVVRANGASTRIV